MRKSIVTAALAGTIAVTGAAFAVPALADNATTAAATTTSTATTTTPGPTATDGTTDARPSPQARITEALAGLVTDGTITQDQADAVATTLAEQLPRGGPGGHGGGDHDGFGRAALGQIATAAADALGVTEADLRAELEGGKSVADVAQEQGVDLDTVITAVTEVAQTQIAQAVSDGKITQEQADTMTADLTDEITEEVNEVHDGDHDGRGGRGGPFGGSDGSGSTAAPTS